MTNSSTVERQRTLVQAIGLTLAGQGGMLLAGTLVGILSARLLGPGGKGMLTTAIIAGGVLNLLSELGLRAAVIRTVASGKASWKEGVATMTLIYGGVCIIVIPTAILIFQAFHERLFPGIPLSVIFIATAGAPIGLIEGSLTCALIGNQRMPEVSAIWMIEKFGIAAGLASLVGFIKLGIIGAVIAQVGGTVLGIIIALFLLSRIPGGRIQIRYDLIGGMLRFGSAWYGRNLATSLNYRLDALLVYFFKGAYAAGLYSIAVSLAELLQYLPNSIDAVLFPRVSMGENIAIEERTARLSRFTVFVTVVCGLILGLLGYPVISILFGQAFTAGFPALLLLLPGMVVLGQSKVIFSEILGRGNSTYPAIASWIGLIVTVGLDLLFIPRLGISGAALASTLAYSTSAIVGLLYYRSITGVGIRALYALRANEVADLFARISTLLRRKH